MSEEYNEALTTLQDATLASVGQTKASQTLAEIVSNKMTVIDSTLDDKVIEVDDALSLLDNRIRSTELFQVSGDQNDIVLSSIADFIPITTLAEQDNFKFIATATNTSAVTVQLDGLDSINLVNVTQANQIYLGALVTLTYINGAFYLTEQINPKTGNATRDIGKLIVDTTNVLEVGEVAFNGATLSRTEHPIMWAKIQATSNLVAQATKNTNLTTYGGYYGDGDGSTTFTLPILGGEFIRLFDDERGVDAGRVLGSLQGDQNASHTHTMSSAGNHSHSGSTSTTGNHAHSGSTSTAGNHVHNQTINGLDGGTHGSHVSGTTYNRDAIASTVNTGAAGNHSHTYTTNTTGNHSHSFSTNSAGSHTHTIYASGGDETRPRSIAYYAKTRL